LEKLAFSTNTLVAEPSLEDQVKGSKNPNYFIHVKLRGTVKDVIFPGPPCFFSVADGDYEEPRWILDVDKPSLLRLVEAQASVTADNYLYEFIDTTIKADEPNAHIVTIDSSFNGDLDGMEPYENKVVTIDAVISAQLARCHTPFVVEIVEVLSNE